MPIIDMKKVYLLGHRQERQHILDLLHEFGGVELSDVKEGASWQEFESLLEPENLDTSLSNLESQLSEVRFCLDLFQRYFPVRKNFVQQFTGAKLELTPDDYNQHLQSLDDTGKIYSKCREIEDTLTEVRNEETRCYNMIEELTPWEPLEVPLGEISDGSYVSLKLYQVSREQYEPLKTTLEENKLLYYLEDVSVDNEFVYIFLVFLNREKEQVLNILKDFSVTPVTFDDYNDTAEQHIKYLHGRLEEIDKEKENAKNAIEELLEYRPLMMSCYDYLDNELKKHNAVTNLAGTDNSFLLEGWLPAPLLDDFHSMLTVKTETAVLVSRDPGPKENVPVMLHNKGPVDAYEVVTKLYSTPKTAELDPTPYLAPFFFLFFGICLSDAGYGVILAALALLASRKLRLAGMGKQLINLLFLGGISAVVFGLLFGGYFGDLIDLPPIWFDPLEDPMQMLFYCFGIGLFHVYFGMGLQAYRNIKAGQPLSALFDQGVWVIFLSGLVLLLLPESAVIGQWMAIGGAAGLILTQGRTQQGLVKKILSGFVCLYNVTGYLSDVFSYSRLLALGLATGVIATAINSMGGMVAGTIVGAVAMVLILLVGHLFNIIISTLSSYVHTSRLQYIEFFGKFFEGGGKSFKPFRPQTSYIDVYEAEDK